MARSIPISWVMAPGEIIYLTRLDEVDKPDNTPDRSCPSPCSGKSCASSQRMVDQTPCYDRKRRRKSNRNQVIGKGGLIRPDKRVKAKYL